MVRRLLRDRRVHAGRVGADPPGRRGARTEAAHPCRRARTERRIAGRGARRRALGRSPDLRPRRRHPRAGGRRRRRHAAADRRVLPEAGALRPGARADRRRRRGGARDRRQSRRRLLAVDAVRHDARLLRHGPDVRGGAGRRDDQRRPFARPRGVGRQPRTGKADGRGARRRRRDRPHSRRRGVDCCVIKRGKLVSSSIGLERA